MALKNITEEKREVLKNHISFIENSCKFLKKALYENDDEFANVIRYNLQP